MKVGLFLGFAGRKCGGPEVYEREIVREMATIAPEHDYHLFCLDQRAPLVVGLDQPNVSYHLLNRRSRVLSMAFDVPAAVARVRPDVLHALVMPAPYFPMPFVMTMPCSTSIYHPGLLPPLVRWRILFLFHRAVPRAARVVCISEHVRKAVMEKFRLPAERLPLIYPGVSPMFQPIHGPELRQRLESHGIRYPYFLFSGRWEPRKNVVGTIRAFARFKRECPGEHRLVFTGQRTWAAQEAARVIAELKLTDVVVDLGKTPVPELPFLYAGATALVFASIWEGFGLPIVEAMSCGTPVITSNAAAMPETAGGAALLVDPHSEESIAAAMHRIATDSALAAELRSRGLQRAKSFSWHETARRTLDLYEQTAGENGMQGRRGSAIPAKPGMTRQSGALEATRQ